jgi:ketosteroid isomerase-like protein
MNASPRDVMARRLYAALDGRDTRGLVAVVDDASLLHVAGTSGLAGDYQGREAIAGLLRHTAELAGGTVRYGAARSEIDTSGRTALAGRASATRRGRCLEAEVRLAVRVDGGVVREAWLAFTDQAACDRFWS